MKGSPKHIVLLVTGLAFLACTRIMPEENGQTGKSPEAIPVELALALDSGVPTRASISAITEMSNQGDFRGLENIRLVPFASPDRVVPGDVAIGPARGLPAISSSMDDAAYTANTYHSGLVRNNHAHLYPGANAALPNGTASVLIYGNGISVARGTTPRDKHLNGSLIETGWEELGALQDASAFTFSPDPIYTGGIPASATALTDILTSIASSVSCTKKYYYRRNEVWYEGQIAVQWSDDLAETVLREYYRWFTSDGELMTGAGKNVEYLLSMLYGRLRRYDSDDEEPYLHMAGGVYYPTFLTEGGTEPFTYGELYDGLRDEILQRFTQLKNAGSLRLNADDTVTLTNSELLSYPIDMGLPAGGAVIRWNGLRFVVVTEGLDGIAAIDRYCYMPPLYFRANTTLSTCAERDIYKQYTSQTTTWDQILSHYRLGKVVDGNTHGVALDAPLQYATGMLVASVRATASLLPDNDGDPRTNCSVTGTNFPVTGVIIGSQYRQDFDFNPVTSSEEFYLYDNQISGVYLTTAESSEFRTLVLPTPIDHDVYFFLEFRNDSGATFSGAEGLIFPGNYFYLVGKLEMPDDPDYPSVFMQDSYTTVRCIISTLENAHVAIPKLDTPQLVMGVQCTLNWIMSESSYVVLD
jgi:hypothetical protein